MGRIRQLNASESEKWSRAIHIACRPSERRRDYMPGLGALRSAYAALMPFVDETAETAYTDCMFRVGLSPALLDDEKTTDEQLSLVMIHETLHNVHRHRQRFADYGYYGPGINVYTDLEINSLLASGICGVDFNAPLPAPDKAPSSWSWMLGDLKTIETQEEADLCNKREKTSPYKVGDVYWEGMLLPRIMPTFTCCPPHLSAEQYRSILMDEGVTKQIDLMGSQGSAKESESANGQQQEQQQDAGENGEQRDQQQQQQQQSESGSGSQQRQQQQDQEQDGGSAAKQNDQQHDDQGDAGSSRQQKQQNDGNGAGGKSDGDGADVQRDQQQSGPGSGNGADDGQQQNSGGNGSGSGNGSGNGSGSDNGNGSDNGEENGRGETYDVFADQDVRFVPAGDACGAGDIRRWVDGIDKDVNDPVWEEVDAAGIHPISRTEEATVRDRLQYDIAEYTKNRGDSWGLGVGDAIIDFVANSLRPPAADWRSLLRRITSRATRNMVAGRDDYSYTRINRRHVARRYILPGLVAYTPKIRLAIDTSGSMGVEDYMSALSEAEGIIKEVKGDIEIVAIDTDVHDEPKRVTSAKDIAKLLRGGGGTDMAPAIEQVCREKKAKRPDVLVIATDGLFPWDNFIDHVADKGFEKTALVMVVVRKFDPGWSGTASSSVVDLQKKIRRFKKDAYVIDAMV